jgi:RHS repeat-associated protein
VLWARHCEPESPSWACFRAADPLKVSIDPNGNLTTKTEGTDTWGYEWNARNELTRVTKNSVEQARFAYDPLGRRVEKVAGGVTNAYAYDGVSILREVRGSTTLKYVHGPGMDEPLAADDGSAFSYLHADGLGSIAKMTSAAGMAISTRQYDAWGNLEAGASQPGYAFTGREWDPEVGLYYYRARYYDSKAGKFISEDPVGVQGGLNFYTYVENSPTDGVDPSGLSPQQCAGPCDSYWISGFSLAHHIPEWLGMKSEPFEPFFNLVYFRAACPPGMVPTGFSPRASKDGSSGQGKQTYDKGAPQVMFVHRFGNKALVGVSFSTSVAWKTRSSTFGKLVELCWTCEPEEDENSCPVP